MLAHAFGPVDAWPDQDLVGFSNDLDVDITMAAYSSGLFPMPLHESGFGGMCWWSPMNRGVIELSALRVHRSLRKMAKHYTTTVDTAFDRVILACADPHRPGGWIDDEITRVYTELFGRGIVHSVETWDPEGRLVGGLYGVSMGGLFAGESMFHDPEAGRDASKVALVRLAGILGASTGTGLTSEDMAPATPAGSLVGAQLSGPGGAGALLDVQWLTPHLATMGAVEIPRRRYLHLLGAALDRPGAVWPTADDSRRRGYGVLPEGIGHG